MSSYVDIYNDYPLRCAKLWEDFNASAEDKNLEVSFMLMCATGGFVTPYEHLRIQPGQSKELRDHPAYHNFDEVNFKRSARTMEEALSPEAFSSPLFQNIRLDNCFYGRCEGIEFIRDMAESRTPNNYSIRTQKTLNLMRVLRNSLAHNNIYAFARNSSNEISELTFFSEFFDRKQSKCEQCSRKFDEPKRKPYTYEILSMPVQEFHAFLNSWFALLRRASLKGNQIKSLISKALEVEDELIASYG
jgi:hypothetical protein